MDDGTGKRTRSTSPVKASTAASRRVPKPRARKRTAARASDSEDDPSQRSTQAASILQQASRHMTTGFGSSVAGRMRGKTPAQDNTKTQVKGKPPVSKKVEVEKNDKDRSDGDYEDEDEEEDEDSSKQPQASSSTQTEKPKYVDIDEEMIEPPSRDQEDWE